MDLDMVYSLAVGASALALTYSVIHDVLGISKRPAAVIAFAFGLITYLYLRENPAVLADTVSKIATALIGAVVALAISVRSRGR